MHLVIWSAIATDHLKMSVNWVWSSESMTKISQTAKLFVGSHVDPHSYIHTWLVLGLPTQESEGFRAPCYHPVKQEVALGYIKQWNRVTWTLFSWKQQCHKDSGRKHSHNAWNHLYWHPWHHQLTSDVRCPSRFSIWTRKHQDRFNGITCLPNGYFTPLPLQAIRTDPFALRMTHWGWPSPTNGKCHVWLLTGTKKNLDVVHCNDTSHWCTYSPDQQIKCSTYPKRPLHLHC